MEQLLNKFITITKQQMMRTITLLIAILFPIQLAFSQGNVVITGKIINHGSKSIQIGDYTTNIDSLGNFKLSFELLFPDVYSLSYQGNGTSLFFEPNDSLNIRFDANDFYNSCTCTGANELIQNFLKDLSIKSKPVEAYFYGHWNDLISSYEDEFAVKINEQKSLITQPIDSFIKINSDKISPYFSKYYKLNTELFFNRFIYIYPSLHFDYISLEDQLKYRQRHLQIETFDQNDTKLLRSESYKDLMKSILRLKVINYLVNDSALKKSDNQWITAYQKATINSFTNDTVRNYWLHYYLNDHIENFGVKNIESLIKEFNNVCTDAVYKKEINKKYQDALSKRQNHQIKTYKRIDGFDLDAHIFKPKDIKPDEKRTAILYFHGGGYSSGNPDWHCFYNENGFIQISFEYRIYDRHGTMPFAAIEDSKSAIRWVRENAEILQIDTNKIIATGNSCGAAMVCATALLDSLDNPKENLKISSKPTAMILNAAGYDQTDKFGPMKDKNSLARISGINLVKPNAPACLVIHGSDDWGIPISEASEFVTKMRAAGNLCEFKVLKGAGHVPWLTPPYSTESYNARQDFLRKIGYIN